MLWVLKNRLNETVLLSTQIIFKNFFTILCWFFLFILACVLTTNKVNSVGVFIGAYVFIRFDAVSIFIA